MTTHGIDVSKHNGTINWAAVKASGKVDFAILRAGYGKVVSQKDAKFDYNYQGCKDNGIPCGVYWYSYAMSVADAEKEADACLAVLKGKTFEYPVYFDFEERSQLNLGRIAVSAIVKAFCTKIEKAGYFAGIYSMKSGLESYLTPEVRNAYTNWVAHIVTKTTYSGHDMWQYSWKGRINGISGDVDCSYCYKDFPAIISGKNASTTPEPATTPTTPETPAPTKTIAELALEVLDGKWGNGTDRRKNLTDAGYDYVAVQTEVNKLVKQKAITTTYTVKKGDTLSAIASKYKTTVKKIVSDNKTKYPQITANFIKVGWILKV